LWAWQCSIQSYAKKGTDLETEIFKAMKSQSKSQESKHQIAFSKTDSKEMVFIVQGRERAVFTGIDIACSL
jgi:hypothetical protein